MLSSQLRRNLPLHVQKERVELERLGAVGAGGHQTRIRRRLNRPLEARRLLRTEMSGEEFDGGNNS